MRLDNILLEEGLATKAQIEEALDYQKKYGGRLESHLLRFGYVSENNLLKALSRQFNCKCVNVSDLNIPKNILDYIPAEIVWKKIILPFEYNSAADSLKVACENPRDQYLTDELASVIGVQKIELYLAIGSTLRCSILQNYRKHLREVPVNKKVAGEQPNLSKKFRSFKGKPCKILIHNKNNLDFMMIEKNLNKSDYHIMVSHSIEECKKLYNEENPDILLLLKSGSAMEVSDFIIELVVNEIPIDQVPTLLVPNGVVVNELIPLLKDGVEDVIPIDEGLEPLIIKLNRIRERMEAANTQRVRVIQDLGTHGTLQDMSLIDLIQAMGTSKKTARISITGQGKQLTMYLDKGNIIYAECEGKVGPEAVYQGIPWTRGIWSVDPVEPEKLPEPNNFESNDSILLEGCRLMDEETREDTNEEESPGTFDFTWDKSLPK